jgi:hypothetical protein
MSQSTPNRAVGSEPAPLALQLIFLLLVIVLTVNTLTLL